jgi:hypothetical protein
MTNKSQKVTFLMISFIGILHVWFQENLFSFKLLRRDFIAISVYTTKHSKISHHGSSFGVTTPKSLIQPPKFQGPTSPRFQGLAPSAAQGVTPGGSRNPKTIYE